MKESGANRVKILGITGAVLLAVSGIAFVVVRLLQMIRYFDPDAGLLRREDGVSLMNWVLLGLLCLGILAAVPVAVYIHQKDKLLPAPAKRCVPIGMSAGYFVMGVCFLIQSVDELLNGYEIIGKTETDIYSMLLTGVGFCAALVLILGAYRIVSVGKAPGMAAMLIPVIWNLLLILRMMWNAAAVVSVQPIPERTIVSLAAMVYFYFLLRQQAGVREGRAGPVLTYLLTLAPFVLLGGTLPYLIGWFFGVQDFKPTVPHTALLGVAVALSLHLIFSLRGKYEVLDGEEAGEEELPDSAEE